MISVLLRYMNMSQFTRQYQLEKEYPGYLFIIRDSSAPVALSVRPGNGIHGVRMILE